MAQLRAEYRAIQQLVPTNDIDQEIMSENSNTTERTDNIITAVLNDLNAGILTNGSWIKQADLESRYGCTRADARRTLEKLAIKGIVQRIPNRGFYVTKIDEARHKELVEVRIVLETATLEDVIRNATPHDISTLRQLADDFSSLIREGSAIDKFNANRAFHSYLTQLCSNKELVRLTLDYRGNLPTTPIVQWQTLARIERSAREHEEMVQAIEDKDLPRLIELTRNHIKQPAPATSKATEVSSA